MHRGLQTDKTIMDLPGKKISLPIRPYLNGKLIPTGVCLAIIIPIFIHQRLTPEFFFALALIAIPLFSLVVWFGPKLIGKFVEVSVVDEGMWISDGIRKNLVLWKDITSFHTTAPRIGYGWPAILFRRKGTKTLYRATLRSEKGKLPNAAELPEIKFISEKLTSQAPQLKDSKFPKTIRLSFILFAISAVGIMLGYILLAFNDRPSRYPQKAWVKSECIFYSRNASDLTSSQNFLRKMKLIIHSPAELEAYRTEMCGKAGLNLPRPQY